MVGVMTYPRGKKSVESSFFIDLQDLQRRSLSGKYLWKQIPSPSFEQEGVQDKQFSNPFLPEDKSIFKDIGGIFRKHNPFKL